MSTWIDVRNFGISCQGAVLITQRLYTPNILYYLHYFHWFGEFVTHQFIKFQKKKAERRFESEAANNHEFTALLEHFGDLLLEYDLQVATTILFSIKFSSVQQFTNLFEVQSSPDIFESYAQFNSKSKPELNAFQIASKVLCIQSISQILETENQNCRFIATLLVHDVKKALESSLKFENLLQYPSDASLAMRYWFRKCGRRWTKAIFKNLRAMVTSNNSLRVIAYLVENVEAILELLPTDFFVLSQAADMLLCRYYPNITTQDAIGLVFINHFVAPCLRNPQEYDVDCESSAFLDAIARYLVCNVKENFRVANILRKISCNTSRNSMEAAMYNLDDKKTYGDGINALHSILCYYQKQFLHVGFQNKSNFVDQTSIARANRILKTIPRHQHQLSDLAGLICNRKSQHFAWYGCSRQEWKPSLSARSKKEKK